MDDNINGIMESGEKIRLLFNLEIISDEHPDHLTVVRNEVDVTDKALGNGYSFEVSDGNLKEVIITLGNSPNLQPGDVITFTESDNFHPDGSVNEGHECKGVVFEKPVPLKEASGLEDRNVLLASNLIDDYLVTLEVNENSYFLHYLHNSKNPYSVDPILTDKRSKPINRNTSVTTFLKQGLDFGISKTSIFGFAEEPTKIYQHTYREQNAADNILDISDETSFWALEEESLPCALDTHNRILVDGTQIDFNRDGHFDFVVTIVVFRLI